MRKRPKRKRKTCRDWPILKRKHIGPTNCLIRFRISMCNQCVNPLTLFGRDRRCKICGTGQTLLPWPASRWRHRVTWHFEKIKTLHQFRELKMWLQPFQFDALVRFGLLPKTFDWLVFIRSYLCDRNCKAFLPWLMCLFGCIDEWMDV